MKLVLSCFVILLCACAGYEDSDPDAIGDFAADGSNAAAGNSSETLDQRDLMGLWAQGCSSSDSNTFRKRTATFQDESFTLTEDYFPSDPTCSQASQFTTNARFTFDVPNYSPNVQNNMDLTVERVFFRFNTIEAVKIANQTAACGFTDWQVAAQKEVTGNPCSELPASGESLFQIFQIQAPNLLFIGQNNTGASDSSFGTRPTLLDPLPFFRP